MSISTIVLTKNEKGSVEACLAGLAWADEVLVLDSGSENGTVELAQRLGARVEARPFDSYPAQRNAAIEMAKGEWVFFVDADERVPEDLAQEVQEAIRGHEVGFWVPRQNYIFGKWIRHAGWYPDYQMRLFLKDKGRYDEGREVHEIVNLDGSAGYMKGHLIHYNYANLSEFISRQKTYTEMEARYLLKEGQRAKAHSFLLQPLREFRRRFITLEGYKDGGYGLLLSGLMAYYEGVKYSRLRRLQGTGA